MLEAETKETYMRRFVFLGQDVTALKTSPLIPIIRSWRLLSWESVMFSHMSVVGLRLFYQRRAALCTLSSQEPLVA